MSSYPIVYTREGFIEVLSTEFEEEAEFQSACDLIGRWLEREDGVAVYENQDLGHPELGHKKFVSYGGPAAQLGTVITGKGASLPPNRLPDIGNEINWRYVLVGVYRGESL